MVRPRNVTNADDADPAFAACKRLGLRTLACSPFVRGRWLDKLVAHAGEGRRARIADAMLRFSLFGENVDGLIVGIRKPEWVAANVAAAARGPLSEDERNWLTGMVKEL